MLSTPIKFLLAGAASLGLVAASAANAASVTAISGAGATFPYPVYAKWASAYHKQTGVKMNYQSIGSGGGIQQIEHNTVDFGASDAPLQVEELQKNDLVQFPTVMGGVVPVVNIPGIKPGEMKISPAVLADIYLGKIKKWNDPALIALNPGLKLPGQIISVVHRADGSGTTWIYTNYLSKVSPEWKKTVGNDKSVSWPVGVGGKGNEGVASYVRQIKGSIGYVEYAYALQNHMTHVKLQNHDGVFVDPTSDSFQAAAANADWEHTPGFYMVLTDQPGEKSWPITGATFILIHKKQAKPDVARAVLDFFAWAYANGDKMAEALDYVPMPDKVVKLVEGVWAKDVKDGSGQPIWSAGNAN